MALAFQPISVPFSGGLDTKTNEKLVLPGKLTLLENGVFTRGKEIILRNGYLAASRTIAGGTTFSSGDGLGVLGNELALFSGKKVYSYAQVPDQWVDKGNSFSVKVSNSQVVRNAYQQTLPDSATNLGVRVHAWVDARGGVRASVFEEATGAQYQSDVELSATGGAPRVLAVSDYLFVFYVEGTNLRLRRLSPLAPTTFEAATTLFNNISASPDYYYDVDVSGLKAIVAYNSTASIRIGYVTRDGTVGSTAIGLPDPIQVAQNPENCLTIRVDPTTLNIWVAFNNSAAGLRAFARYPDLTSLAATTTLDGATAATAALRLTIGILSTLQCQVFYEVTAVATYNHFIKQCTFTTAAVAGSAAVLIRSVGLASKAFEVGGLPYFHAVFDSTLQATFFLLRYDGAIVAKILPGRAGGLPADHFVPNVISPETNVYSMPAQTKNKFVSEGNTTFTIAGISQVTHDFDAAEKYQNSELQGGTQIAGGFLASYDGHSVFETGFHLFPENVTAVAAAAAGSMADGAYTYYVVYAWTDNAGQVHRSAPSIGLLATVSGGGGNGKVTLTIPTLRVTAKTRTNVVLEVYRTKASGIIPFKVSSVSSPTFNSTTADTVTYVDTQNDTAIGANEILYTTGGILENIGPPPASTIDVYQNRAVLVNSENPLEVWFSKIKVKNEGLAFNDSLFFRVDPLGGDVKVPKMMDDKIILFKKERIFFVAGEGPNDLGQLSTYTAPQLVTADVGCVDPKSVVLMPEGIMFKSSKGIYLLDRSLQTSYVGAEVEAYNSQTIVSAEQIQNKNQVRFLTNDGVALVYDYFFKQWSTFTNHEGLDAVNWNGTYSYLRSDGKVYQESETLFTDDGVEYKLRMATAWLKLGGIQGFQRVRRIGVLGNFFTSHILRVQVGYDYASVYSYPIIFNAGSQLDTTQYGDDATFGSSTPYGGAEDNVYQFRSRLRRQKCEAVRFLFESLTGGTPGQAYSLTDLTLEVGLKRGINRLKAAKTV